MHALTLPLNVDTLIDSRPLGRFQWGLVGWCALLMGIDGYDMQLAAYTAPWLIKTWTIERASFGAVFGAGLTGYMLGALLLSMAGDRRGRKTVILWSTTLFALVTLISATATSRDIMMLYRFVAGIGLGGCIANVIALAAEVAPRGERVRVVALLFAGYTGGAALGGALSALLIPRLGWESAFLLGGAAPLALIPLLSWRLQESVRLLAGQHAGDARLRSLMSRFAPDIDFATARFAAPARAAAAGLPLHGLFARGRALLTVVLWTAFVTSFLGHHFVTSWLPTLLNGMGVSLPGVVLAGSLLQAGAFVGCVFVALTADRRGIIVTALAFLCAAPLMLAIGHFGGDPGVGMPLVFAAGICLIGGQTGLNALAAGFYDTEFRATGAGWALGVGRIGAILGPVVGGMLLSAGVPVPELFAWAAVPALICSATVFILHFLARTSEGPTSGST